MKHTVTYNHQSQFIEMFGYDKCAYLPLREVCLRYGEYGSNTPSIPFEEGHPRYIRITDLNYDGTLNDDKVCAKEIDNKYILSEGDFLFARTGATVGKTYCHKDGDALYAGYLIRYVTNPDKILPKFLSIYTKTQSFWSWIKGQMKIGAQPNISSKQYNELPVPVPSIEEQTSFLSFVRQADKSKFDGFKSQFIEMPQIGKTVKLGELCSLRAGKNIKAERIYPKLSDNLYPCYGGNGIRGYVDTYTNDGNYCIIGRQGALCGNIQLAEGKFYLTEHGVLVNPFEQVEILWLFYALTALNLNQYARGVAQPGLAVNQLEEIQFFVPDIHAQKEFAEIVRQADKSKYYVQNKLNYICHILTKQIPLRRCS